MVSCNFCNSRYRVRCEGATADCCRGGSRFFLGGGALLRNGVTDWWPDLNISCIGKPQVISEGGGRTPCTFPLYPCAVLLTLNGNSLTGPTSCYSRLPITRTLANSNQNRLFLDSRHTLIVILPSVLTRTKIDILGPSYTVTLPSVTRALSNSKQFSKQFSFPFRLFCISIILPSITRTVMPVNTWQVKTVHCDFAAFLCYVFTLRLEM